MKKRLAERLQGMKQYWHTAPGHGFASRKLALPVAGLLLLAMLYSLWVSWTPAVVQTSAARNDVIGVKTVSASIAIAETLLDKHGGYISNDISVPWLDNIKNWEFGVLKQIRDFNRVLRNEISRSQSQSAEDRVLAQAEPKFNIDNRKWMFPRAEKEYRAGIAMLKDYRSRLQARANDAHFYANSENLVDWMAVIEKRLGSTVQRLGMSTGKVTLDDAALEQVAEQGDVVIEPRQVREHIERTPWTEIDDVFFEARGTAWALTALLKAAEADFAEVLTDKQATLQYRQIIRELEAANGPLRTVMILNGGGFSIWPNHSLVMASYLGAANAALSNLIGLLENG